MDVIALRLLDAWRQCERHLHHLNHSVAAITPSLPVSAISVSAMDDEAVQDWDQFVLRFTKLQDAMGTRLYPALLAYLQEPYEGRPMLDKLHRLEKLAFIVSVDEWHNLRAIRNHFSHDYPEDDALKAAYLNEAVSAVPMLKALLARVEPVVLPMLEI